LNNVLTFVGSLMVLLNIAAFIVAMVISHSITTDSTKVHTASHALSGLTETMTMLRGLQGNDSWASSEHFAEHIEELTESWGVVQATSAGEQTMLAQFAVAKFRPADNITLATWTKENVTLWTAFQTAVAGVSEIEDVIGESFSRISSSNPFSLLDHSSKCQSCLSQLVTVIPFPAGQCHPGHHVTVLPIHPQSRLCNTAHFSQSQCDPFLQ
jgi:hypothetical protein